MLRLRRCTLILVPPWKMVLVGRWLLVAFTICKFFLWALPLTVATSSSHVLSPTLQSHPGWTAVCLFLHILHWLAIAAFFQHSLVSLGTPQRADQDLPVPYRERERERQMVIYLSCLFAINWYILIFVRSSLVVGWENDLLHGSFL